MKRRLMKSTDHFYKADYKNDREKNNLHLSSD